MDFLKLNEAALSSARQTLVQHFDWEAFLVYSAAMQNIKNIPTDDIAGTEIDDNIKHVFDDFVKYYNKKSKGESAVNELTIMMNTMKKIIFELYYQTSSDEKQVVIDSINSINAEIKC